MDAVKVCMGCAIGRNWPGMTHDCARRYPNLVLVECGCTCTPNRARPAPVFGKRR